MLRDCPCLAICKRIKDRLGYFLVSLHGLLCALFAVIAAISSFNIDLDVVVLHLLLGAVANVICNVGPITKPISLTTVDQQKFLICPPVVAKDGVGVLLHYAIVVPCLVLAWLRS